MGNSTEKSKFTNLWIKSVSAIAICYLIFSLSSPIFLKTEKQPRKIETSDIVLVTLILIFNSGLIDRLEDFSISDGKFNAKFKQLEEQVSIQDKKIEEQQKEIVNQGENIHHLEEIIIAYNSREDIYRENPHLENKELALVGLKVRHGDIIDAITPIYAIIQTTPDLRLGKEVKGKHYGGFGGDEATLERNGYIVTGVNIYKADYFGREEVVHIQLIWNKLTQQGIETEPILSKKLGTGEYAKNIWLAEEIRAKTGYYICNFNCKTSDHTSGETFLHDFKIETKELLIPVSV